MSKAKKRRRRPTSPPRQASPVNQTPAAPPVQSPIPTSVKSRRTQLLAILALAICAIAILYFYVPTVHQFINSLYTTPVSVTRQITKNPSISLKKTNNTTNVLLIGIDRRSDEPFEFKGQKGQTYFANFRSDTIVVASYNYQSEQVTLLSLPRDLWVTIPAFGKVKKHQAKINSAYGLGDAYEYLGGGQALLARVVEQVTGQPIHYTARIDFSGFEQAVDAVGGIDVNVEHSFTDYGYPIEGMEDAEPPELRYKTISFQKGLQHMNGQTALEYARSRHGTGEEGTDFARSKRQQRVIEAFKTKVLSTHTLVNPLSLFKLVDTLGDSFATTLSPIEAPAALSVAQKANQHPILSYNLDDRPDHPGGILYAPPLEKYGGAYVLIPKKDPQAIKKFVKQIFSAQGYPSQPTPTPTKKPLPPTPTPTGKPSSKPTPIFSPYICTPHCPLAPYAPSGAGGGR